MREYQLARNKKDAEALKKKLRGQGYYNIKIHKRNVIWSKKTPIRKRMLYEVSYAGATHRIASTGAFRK